MAMNADIIMESLPQLQGVCNLCLNEGAVKSMLVSHNHNGITEDYVEMLQRCFSIDISLLELGDSKRLICDSCISRLRDVVRFRRQVEESLDMLETTYKLHKEALLVKQETADNEDTSIDMFNLHTHEVDAEKDAEEASLVKQETADDEDTSIDMFNLHTDEVDEKDKEEASLVKQEAADDEDTFIDMFNLHTDEVDDEKDKDFKPPIKKPSEVKESKKSNKPIKYSRKLPHDIHETESMLQFGLFPFKIKKNKTLSCSICPETSNSIDELKSHICQHKKYNIHLAFNKMMFSDLHRFYKSSTKLRCKICTADISNFDELKEHIENCTLLKHTPKKWNNLPFKLEKDQLDCPVCKKKFLNFVSLNTHMNVHYPNFICENCGKAFASKARLRGHMRTHEEGQFPCRYCEAVFDRAIKRQHHVSKEHKAGVRYACKRCNISLTSFYARQKHLAEVHNEELKRYKCKACPQSYITPGHLSSHVRRDHLNERNHKCDKCDLAFHTKRALKMHNIKHDGERIHVCNVCQKSYQRKKTLREHMRIHDNDKRFVCPVCGRAFTQKCTLKGHLKVHDRKVDIDDRVGLPLHSI